LESLEQFSEKQGYKTGHYASKRWILKDPEAKSLFIGVAEAAKDAYISDTVAAQYLVDNYKQFQHLNYNTVRRYFKDYRDGRIK